MKPVGVHLVGSAPVAGAEEMFRIAMAHLGGHLKRLPDGEPGERDTWIRWQHRKIEASPQVRRREAENVYVPVAPFALVAGSTDAADIEFPDLGYAEAAIASFDVFRRLTGEGVMPGEMRFLVGLPTPLSVATFYVEPESRTLFEEAYGRALRRELARMLEHIPPEKLAVQWETVAEFALLEGTVENHLAGDLLDAVTTRVATLVDAVPEPAEAGIHLCYGDSGHKHFCEPADAGHLARVAGKILAEARRPVGWIHLPVPRERDDAGYFAALADLDVPAGTDLYLGLVHRTGGETATRRRIEAASTAVARFGVATECGLGRRDRDTIPDLLRQHAAVATPP